MATSQTRRYRDFRQALHVPQSRNWLHALREASACRSKCQAGSRLLHKVSGIRRHELLSPWRRPGSCCLAAATGWCRIGLPELRNSHEPILKIRCRTTRFRPARRTTGSTGYPPVAHVLPASPRLAERRWVEARKLNAGEHLLFGNQSCTCWSAVGCRSITCRPAPPGGRNVIRQRRSNGFAARGECRAARLSRGDHNRDLSTPANPPPPGSVRAHRHNNDPRRSLTGRGRCRDLNVDVVGAAEMRVATGVIRTPLVENFTPTWCAVA